MRSKQIANAGVMAIPTLTLTEDGFETQFGTNHLGHFVFINRIAPLFARFCEDCHVADIVEGEFSMNGGVRAYALDADNAKALWAKSEELVGEKF